MGESHHRSDGFPFIISSQTQAKPKPNPSQTQAKPKPSPSQAQAQVQIVLKLNWYKILHHKNMFIKKPKFNQKLKPKGETKSQIILKVTTK